MSHSAHVGKIAQTPAQDSNALMQKPSSTMDCHGVNQRESVLLGRGADRVAHDWESFFRAPIVQSSGRKFWDTQTPLELFCNSWCTPTPTKGYSAIVILEWDGLFLGGYACCRTLT